MRHLRIGELRLTPELVQFKEATIPGTTTFAPTLDSTPIEGNILIAALGGTQLRTVTFPSGWVDAGVSYLGGGTTGTHRIAYKIAGAGESTTHTFTFGAGLDGGGTIYEFTRVDSTPVLFKGGFCDTVAVTSVLPIAAGFAIPYSGIGISSVQVGSGTGSSWNPDNAYIRHVSGQFVRAFRIYSQADPAANVTWTGTSTNAGAFIVFFKGKPIN